MKYITLLGLAALTSAQSACDSVAAAVPSCAVGCLSSAVASVGCSGVRDYSCQCEPSSSSAIQASAEECVLKACGGKALQVAAAGAAVCACAATAAPDSADSGPSTALAGAQATPSESADDPSGDSNGSDTEGGSGYGAGYPAETPYPASGPVGTAPSSGNGSFPTSIYPPISTGGATTLAFGLSTGIVAVLAAIVAL